MTQQVKQQPRLAYATRKGSTCSVAANPTAVRRQTRSHHNRQTTTIATTTTKTRTTNNLCIIRATPTTTAAAAYTTVDAARKEHRIMCTKTVESHQQHRKCTDEQCAHWRDNKNRQQQHNANDFDVEDVQEQKGKRKAYNTLVHEALIQQRRRARQRGKARDKRQWQSMCGSGSGTRCRRAGIKWKIIISTIILLLCRTSEYNNTYK